MVGAGNIAPTKPFPNVPLCQAHKYPAYHGIIDNLSGQSSCAVQNENNMDYLLGGHRINCDVWRVGYTQGPQRNSREFKTIPWCQTHIRCSCATRGKMTEVFRARSALAKDVGAGERSIRTYLKELETSGLVEIHQRGLGRSNLEAFWILPSPSFKQSTNRSRSRAAKFCRSRAVMISGQDRQILVDIRRCEFNKT